MSELNIQSLYSDDIERSVIIECIKPIQHKTFLCDVGYYTQSFLQDKGIIVNNYSLKCTKLKNHFQVFTIQKDDILKSTTYDNNTDSNLVADTGINIKSTKFYKFLKAYFGYKAGDIASEDELLEKDKNIDAGIKFGAMAECDNDVQNDIEASYIINIDITEYELQKGDTKTLKELESIFGEKIDEYLQNGSILETKQVKV